MRARRDDDDRFIWGARAIGEAINRTEAAVYHLMEAGALDADKIGGRWVSTRRRLLASGKKRVQAA